MKENKGEQPEQESWKEKFEYWLINNLQLASKAHPNYYPQSKEGEENFQSRVDQWMQICFGPEISKDLIERNHRFIEEALELVQSTGATKSECHQLVEYVFNRDIGEVNQEVGGVMVTLAALCNVMGLNIDKSGETELKRIWTKVDRIREKQANKPKHSPLPQSKENEGKQAGVWKALKQIQLLCLKPFEGMEEMQKDWRTVYKISTNAISELSTIQSGERGEVERLKGLIENIFKANEEMALDIMEPRDNIEINWQKFKATHNL